MVALNRTCVAPQKSVPLMVTGVPTGPLVGENDVIVGATAADTVKLSAAVFVDDAPLLTMTSTTPSLTPHGTVAEIVPVPRMVNVAAMPPKVTLVTTGFWNSVPLMVTTVPRPPDVGDSPMTLGVAADAGSAVTSTPTVASPSANAVALAVTFFFWNLIEGSSLLGHWGRCWAPLPGAPDLAGPSYVMRGASPQPSGSRAGALTSLRVYDIR
jgi:hypothetical protein